MKLSAKAADLPFSLDSLFGLWSPDKGLKDFF
jgi:hypothetical protein